MANKTLCHLNLLHLRIFIETFHCEGRFTVSEHESKREGFHRLPLKLWEGNVFSRVCLLFCSQTVPVQDSSLILSIQNPVPKPPTRPQLGPYCTKILHQTCSDLFITKHRLSANVQLTLNWNVFLFFDVGVGKNLSVKDIALSFTSILCEWVFNFFLH